MPKFNCYCVVHKDPAESVRFGPGDEVPEWALPLVGDHVISGDHEAEEEKIDVRLTDPHLEADDPAVGFSTVNTLPPSASAVEDVDDDEDEVDLTKLHKAELIEEAEARGLDTSGTKAELIERILADQDDAEDSDDEDEE